MHKWAVYSEKTFFLRENLRQKTLAVDFRNINNEYYLGGRIPKSTTNVTLIDNNNFLDIKTEKPKSDKGVVNIIKQPKFS